jgi:aspartate/tyrosine/aromatic aminotransferase
VGKQKEVKIMAEKINPSGLSELLKDLQPLPPDLVFGKGSLGKKLAKESSDTINAAVGDVKRGGKLFTTPSMAIINKLACTWKTENGHPYSPLGGRPLFLERTANYFWGDSKLDISNDVNHATAGGVGALFHNISLVLWLAEEREELDKMPRIFVTEKTKRWPGYDAIFAYFQQNFGVEIIDLPHGDGQPFINKVLRAMTEHNFGLLDMVIVQADCHNSTGMNFKDIGDYRLLASFIKDKGGILNADICYTLLTHGDKEKDLDPLYIMRKVMEEMNGDHLMLTSFSLSKSFLQFGDRVGMSNACGSPDLINQIGATIGSFWKFGITRPVVSQAPMSGQLFMELFLAPENSELLEQHEILMQVLTTEGNQNRTLLSNLLDQNFIDGFGLFGLIQHEEPQALEAHLEENYFVLGPYLRVNFQAEGLANFEFLAKRLKELMDSLNTRP